MFVDGEVMVCACARYSRTGLCPMSRMCICSHQRRACIPRSNMYAQVHLFFDMFVNVYSAVCAHTLQQKILLIYASFSVHLSIKPPSMKYLLAHL